MKTKDLREIRRQEYDYKGVAGKNLKTRELDEGVRSWFSVFSFQFSVFSRQLSVVSTRSPIIRFDLFGLAAKRTLPDNEPHSHSTR